MATGQSSSDTPAAPHDTLSQPIATSGQGKYHVALLFVVREGIDPDIQRRVTAIYIIILYEISKSTNRATSAHWLFNDRCLIAYRYRPAIVYVYCYKGLLNTVHSLDLSYTLYFSF